MKLKGPLLRAYFDESGTHASSPVTFISGFIGRTREWRRIRKLWQAEMADEVFHYKERRCDAAKLDRLATILADSSLQVISAGFVGDWNSAISHGVDWRKRFPSCYHMVFEMCVEQMDRWSSELWPGSPISLTFSRQDEYAQRAAELWRTFQGNGLWQSFWSLKYANPALVELQTSDMIAHETFQCMKAGNDESWHHWPLVKKLLATSRSAAATTRPSLSSR
jgi:hypothetical protein